MMETFDLDALVAELDLPARVARGTRTLDAVLPAWRTLCGEVGPTWDWLWRLGPLPVPDTNLDLCGLSRPTHLCEGWLDTFDREELHARIDAELLALWSAARDR